ncbi:MAG: molybdopterin-binding protein [Myxococcota bacterium]|nr:molybdopterin-binding protein [Myxococcota bacterium]
MSDSKPSIVPPLVPRVMVATVALGRASIPDDVRQLVVDTLRAAQFAFVRGVTVNREKQFILQLISNVANANEADAIILIGGVGIGPRDFTCEAVDQSVDRRIEGFGEAYRQLLREEFGAGPGAFLARAAAGVCNKCLVFALPRTSEPLRRAMQLLVIPSLADAVRVAEGRATSSETMPRPSGGT